MGRAGMSDSRNTFFLRQLSNQANRRKDLAGASRRLGLFLWANALSQFLKKGVTRQAHLASIDPIFCAKAC
jgi:hypothetical protein